MDDSDEFLLDIARLILKYEISIHEFYAELGVDLSEDSYGIRDMVVSKLAGIFKGWENPLPGSEE